MTHAELYPKDLNCCNYLWIWASAILITHCFVKIDSILSWHKVNPMFAWLWDFQKEKWQSEGRSVTAEKNKCWWIDRLFRTSLDHVCSKKVLLIRRLQDSGPRGFQTLRDNRNKPLASNCDQCLLKDTKVTSFPL